MKLTEAPTTSSTAPVQLLSAMTITGAPIVATSTRRAGRSGESAKDGEVGLLEASLAESERRRSNAIEETLSLRKLVGVCELEIHKLVEDVLGGHASLASGLPGDTGREEGEDVDKMISFPIYDVSAAPLSTLTTRLSTLLFALRDSASIMASSSAAVQARHDQEMDSVRAEAEANEVAWKAARGAMERELECCKEALVEAEKVIEGWVANGVAAASDPAPEANASAYVCLSRPAILY